MPFASTPCTIPACVRMGFPICAANGDPKASATRTNPGDLGSTQNLIAAEDVQRQRGKQLHHAVRNPGAAHDQPTSRAFVRHYPEGAAAIKDLTTVLTNVQAAANDPTQIGPLVATQLQKVAFFQTSFGKWLTGFLQDQSVVSPLAALKDKTVLSSIGTAATTTLNLLNGGDLQTLIDFIAKELDLQNIPTLPNIDTWLKSKIAAFLNKVLGNVVQQDLSNVQNLVNQFINKANTYYTEAVNAAQKQYEATFVATYESTTADTALLDVVFDFDAGNANLGTLLQNAINGDFTQILIDPTIAGVTLNTGVLTHGIHRQTHVEFTMPFVDMGTTNSTNVVSSMTVKHDGGGRILAYNVQANNDTASFVKGRSSRDGLMTLVLNLNLPVGVQKAPDFQASFGYSLRAAYTDTGTRQLINILTPLVSTYALPLLSADVENFAIDLDKITEAVPTGHLGTSLIALDVAVDSSLPGVWLTAPANPKDSAYFFLSKQIQRRLRTLISNVFFAQPNRFDDLGSAYPLIVYSSLPPMNSFDINNDDPPKIVASTKDDVYWDFPDENFLLALMFDPATQNTILSKMSDVVQILAGLGKDTEFYTPGNLSAVLQAAQAKNDPSSQLPDLLGSLIVFEHGFITSVIEAASDLAKVKPLAGNNSAAALKVLTDFSGAIVTTFNQGLASNLFGGPELAMVGSALFTEVTLALAAAVNTTVPANASPSALFSISLPKPGVKISLDDLKADKLTADQTLVEEKLASPLASLMTTATIVS